jgi:hypothetical protein
MVVPNIYKSLIWSFLHVTLFGPYNFEGAPTFPENLFTLVVRQYVTEACCSAIQCQGHNSNASPPCLSQSA